VCSHQYHQLSHVSNFFYFDNKAELSFFISSLASSPPHPYFYSVTFTASSINGKDDVRYRLIHGKNCFDESPNIDVDVPRAGENQVRLATPGALLQTSR